jgi:hypothetical protein
MEHVNLGGFHCSESGRGEDTLPTLGTATQFGYGEMVLKTVKEMLVQNCMNLGFQADG